MFNGWESVAPYDVNGEDVKIYRELFTSDSIAVDKKGHELDYIALKYLGSEIETYKIMDLNAIDVIENRGDMKRIEKVKIPNGQTV